MLLECAQVSTARLTHHRSMMTHDWSGGDTDSGRTDRKWWSGRSQCGNGKELIYWATNIIAGRIYGNAMTDAVSGIIDLAIAIVGSVVVGLPLIISVKGRPVVV